MKLSKNNKHFLSVALKDKTSNNIYSESKAASVCCYTADIIMHLSEKDLIPLDLCLDKIQIFSDLKYLFENEDNHEKLLAKTVIRSENPFVISMLNLNKTSKIKYFIELICLNRIELIPEFRFFSEFFDELHKTNFLYLYQTNKLEEFAEIRFILQVESFYQKTFLISKDSSYFENEGNSRNEMIMDDITEKNLLAGEKKISMNNTTIKEVTEDEKNMNNETTSRLNQRSMNQDSMCNVGMNEKSKFAANNNNQNNYRNENLKDKETNNNIDYNYEYLKTFSFKNKIELKNTLNLELNNLSGSGKDRVRASITEENLKYSNNILMDFKSKDPAVANEQNISPIKDQKIHSTYNQQRDLGAQKNDKIPYNDDLINEKMREEMEINKSKIQSIGKSEKNYTIENNLKDKSLKFDNNIDFDLKEKHEPKPFDFSEAEGEGEEAFKSINTQNKKGNNIPEPEKEMESEGSFLQNKIKKSRNSKEQGGYSNEKKDTNNKDASERSKNVFLTGKDFETQQNLKITDGNDELKNEENVNQTNDKPLKILNSDSRKQTDNNNNKSNNIEEQQIHKMDKRINEFHNKENNHNDYASGGAPFLSNLNENENENEKEFNYNYVFSNNDIRSENKELEGRSTSNNFFSTNPYGTFLSTKRKRDFPEDQIFEIKFNLGNYNFIYIDLDYTVLKNMKINLEKINKFVQWTWENFRYIKFVIYLPKIQDFFLDLNQDLLKEIAEIFSIADILLFEKKDLLSYKNILKDISGIKKNQTASQFFSFNNTASTFFSNKNINKDVNAINSKRIQQQNLHRNAWEEFFLSEFKIKKRSVPLLVYPTKTLVILDELSSIVIYEKNYENKIIFKTENDFILYPQINHTNQNIIELYKKCLAENYSELRGIFFGGFLSKIMQKPVKVDTIVSKDYTGAYMISIELTKKFLKLFFHQKPYPVNAEFYIIKLDKIIANAKLAEDVHRRRESKFVLDCVNRKKSFLKFYEPLNDQYLKDFFSLRSVSNTMRNFGFEKSKGKFVEPDKNSKLAEKSESLKIDGKFFIGNNNLFKNLNAINNINNAFEGSSNTSNLNLMGIGADSPENNFVFSNYNNFNMLANLNCNSIEGKRGNSLLTRAKPQNMNLSGGINLNANGNNFAMTSKSFMHKSSKVNSAFGKNITVNLPRLVTPQVKIDPEEQMKSYIEFEKHIILN